MRSSSGLMGPSKIDFEPYYKALDLDPSIKLTTQLLNKNFRKKALSSHPDKGGSHEEFELVQESFNMLMSKLEVDAAANNFSELEYEAKICKGGPGIGFGMVVIEDVNTSHIIVKSTLPTIQLQFLSDTANGAILEYDRLIGIDSDDISDWHLARVVQRLSDFRIPVGSVVNLKFSRKMKKDNIDSQNNQLVIFPSIESENLTLQATPDSNLQSLVI